MRYKTMEKYRRAAVKVRASGLAPTVNNIARQAKVQAKHFRALLSKWPDLRQYVGIISSARARRARYETIISDLEKQGMPIAARAVADELEISLSALYRYSARNCKGEDSRLCSIAESLGEQYRRAAVRIKEEGRLVTRKALAFELGKSVSTVNRYVWAHPELSEKLGVVYTQEGHRRLYTKKEEPKKA